jgi:hypothetical protein
MTMNARILAPRSVALACAVAGTVVALTFTGGTALAAGKLNVFSVSGQIKGLLALDKPAACMPGNWSKQTGYWDIRVYLTSKTLHPTAAGAWVLLITAKGGKTSITSTGRATADLQGGAGIKILDSWYAPASAGGGGTVVIASNGESGSLQVTLEPYAGSAKRSITFAGSWSCG